MPISFNFSLKYWKETSSPNLDLAQSFYRLLLEHTASQNINEAQISLMMSIRVINE